MWWLGSVYGMHALPLCVASIAHVTIMASIGLACIVLIMAAVGVVHIVVRVEPSVKNSCLGCVGVRAIVVVLIPRNGHNGSSSRSALCLAVLACSNHDKWFAQLTTGDRACGLYPLIVAWACSIIRIRYA